MWAVQAAYGRETYKIRARYGVNDVYRTTSGLFKLRLATLNGYDDNADTEMVMVMANESRMGNGAWQVEGAMSRFEITGTD